MYRVAGVLYHTRWEADGAAAIVLGRVVEVYRPGALGRMGYWTVAPPPVTRKKQEPAPLSDWEDD